MSIGETSSRDLQLLLWAVAEARRRTRRAEVRHAPSDTETAPAEGSDFFTEWQPSTR
jgi:hypothetical protein